MRVAGICTRNEGAVAQFLDSMLGTLKPDERRHVRTLVFPAANPVIGALVAEDSRPPVQHASRPDGSFAILDGEVYSLKRQPTPLSVDPCNDVDRLLECYIAGGIDGLSRIDGAGTIAVFDSAKGIFSLLRDRWGIAPVYYIDRPEGVIWASDVPALLHIDTPRSLNLAALDFFLGNGFIPSPWTLLNKIQKLPPAYVLTFAVDRSIAVRRYWQSTGQPKSRLNRGEVTERLRTLWQVSLSRRCSENQRVGVLVSSGVDSKLVVAGLSELLGLNISTFTFHYTDYDGHFNEGQEALRAARHFGAEHHELVFQPSDIPERLDWITQNYGEPFTYGLHSAMLGNVRSAGVSILMSGQHGLLFPSERDAYALRYARQPRAIRQCVRATLPLLRRLNRATRPLFLWRLYEAAGNAADELEAVIDCASTRLPASLRGIILPEMFRGAYYSDPTWVPEARQAAAALFAKAAGEFAGESEQDKIIFLHRHFRAAEGSLMWNHVWGRAYGITIRLPFFDSDLCEFILRLRRTSPRKPELRRLAATLMPNDLAYAPRISQVVPISHWFRTKLRDFLQDELAPDWVRELGVFDTKTVEKSISDHLRGHNDHGWKLWAILTVLNWHRRFVRG